MNYRSSVQIFLLTLVHLSLTDAFVVTTPVRPASARYYTEDNEWYSPPPAAQPCSKRPAGTRPLELVVSSPDDLEEFLAARDDRVTVVKFHASWCKSCAKFGLKLSKVQAAHADAVDGAAAVVQEGDMRFASVEFGANEDLCHDVGITRLPTTRIYVNGQLQQEIFGGAEKFHQHQGAFDYYLAAQKRRRRRQQQQREQQQQQAFADTLSRGSVLMEGLLEQEFPSPEELSSNGSQQQAPSEKTTNTRTQDSNTIQQ